MTFCIYAEMKPWYFILMISKDDYWNTFHLGGLRKKYLKMSSAVIVTSSVLFINKWLFFFFFQPNSTDIFLPFCTNICCGYSLEVPCQGVSNEHPQHTFLWRYKQNIYLTTSLMHMHCVLHAICNQYSHKSIHWLKLIWSNFVTKRLMEQKCLKFHKTRH